MIGRTGKSMRLFLLLAILLSCIGCDRVTKVVAMRTLPDDPVKSYWGDTIRIQYAENQGGFLSLGANLSEHSRFLLLTVSNGIFLAAIVGVLLWRWQMPVSRFTSLALLLAGGIGNLIDRIFNDGRVIDFLNLGIGPVRTGIFNVADVAITAGVILLFIFSWDDTPPGGPSEGQTPHTTV